MAKSNRYFFTKRVFKETIVLFLEKDVFKSYLEDYKILEFIHFKCLRDLKKRQINFVVLQGLTIVASGHFSINMYAFYYSKVKVIALLESVKKRSIGQL